MSNFRLFKNYWWPKTISLRETWFAWYSFLIPAPSISYKLSELYKSTFPIIFTESPPNSHANLFHSSTENINQLFIWIKIIKTVVVTERLTFEYETPDEKHD